MAQVQTPFRRAAAFSALLALGLGATPALGQEAGGADDAPMMETIAKKFFPKGEIHPETGPLEPAGRWRLLEGDALTGVLRLSADQRAKAGRYGFFAFEMAGRGIYEGIYNVSPDGDALHGVFWPDGKLNQGPAAGVLELDANARGVGEGALAFTPGGRVEGLSAR